MTETPISLAHVRSIADARLAISWDAYAYITLSVPTVLALVEAVSAAQAFLAQIDSYDSTDEEDEDAREGFRAALSRFVSEQPPNGGNKDSEATA